MITKKILFTCMRNAMITSIIATSFTTVPTKAMLRRYIAVLAGDTAFCAGAASLGLTELAKLDKQIIPNLQASIVEVGFKRSSAQQLITDATKIAPYAPLLILSGTVLTVGGRLSMCKKLSGACLAISSVALNPALLVICYGMRFVQAPNANLMDKTEDFVNKYIKK